MEAARDVHNTHVRPAIEEKAQKLHIRSPYAILAKAKQQDGAATPPAYHAASNSAAPMSIKAVPARSVAMATPASEISAFEIATPGEEPSFLASESTATSIEPATPSLRSTVPDGSSKFAASTDKQVCL